jgi:hypothetical protein
MIKVTINSATGFTNAEYIKLRDAAVLLQEVLSSNSFKLAVLNHRYQDKLQFANNLNMTNEQIYKAIMLGREVLNEEEDEEIDVYVTMYYSLKRVIGYTYPDTARTWINRRYFKKFSSAQIAGNLMHEWLHKAGFDHDFYPTAKRPYSVPYAIGNMVVGLATALETSK